MLTKRQAEALEFIRYYSTVYGYAPSYQDIREALGLGSNSGVHKLIHQLSERGYVRHLPRRARAIEVIDRAR